MDEKTKKIVGIVLAVLALGWGTYTFVFKDSGEAAQDDSNRGPAVRRKVEKPANSAKKGGRRARVKRKTKADEPIVRRERQERSATSAKRRKRRGKTRSIKKAEIRPAA